jgi:hypothetical protein
MIQAAKLLELLKNERHRFAQEYERHRWAEHLFNERCERTADLCEFWRKRCDDEERRNEKLIIERDTDKAATIEHLTCELGHAQDQLREIHRLCLGSGICLRDDVIAITSEFANDNE